MTYEINYLASGGSAPTINNPLFKGTTYEGLVAGTGGGSAFLNLILPSFIGMIFVVGIVSFMFIFLVGAVSWILSGGDKAHVESAKAKITNALIGIVLLFSSIAVVKLVEFFFGIDILLIDIGPLVIQ